MDEMIGKIYEMLTFYGIKIVVAVLIFIVGRWVAKLVRKLTQKVMVKADVDQTLVAFVGNFVYILLLVFVVIAALGHLGIQTTSLIAVIGAAGLAVGLALQGSLSNFAAGVLLIIFRPFKVDDFIEAAGTAGTVEKIQIFTTQLKTADNKTVIIPNSKLTGDNIVNWTVKGTRRVDMVFGIGYEDDIDKAKEIISAVLDSDTRILKDPAPAIAVSELADSSVNFVVRPWVKASDYWGVYFNAMEPIKKESDKAGISIPYPQRDVHVYEHGAA